MHKLLWHSNAPWAPTGYGQQTNLFTRKLKDYYDVGVSAFYGLDGDKMVWNDIPVYPGLGQTYGNEAILGHAATHFGEDKPQDGVLRVGTVLTLLDVWVLDPSVWKQLNVVSWVPVDHEPVPPLVFKYFLDTGAIPIAMSRFGQERLEKLNPLYVPHAVDTGVYYPHPQREARKRVGLPRDAFVVGMVAANKGQPSRKSFPEALRAFSYFVEKHNDAILYLHTEITGRAEGVQLPSIIKSLKIPPENIRFADQYRMSFRPIAPEHMAAIYSTMDVLLNPSRGEGFGIPVLEAQACGVPAIVTDFSAMPEVCGAGWTVGGDAEWSGQLSWHMRPDIEDMVDCLERCYAHSNNAKEKLGHAARQHAMGYHIDKVMEEHMVPALDSAIQAIDKRDEMVELEEEEAVA